MRGVGWEQNEASLKLIINPMVVWIWLGGMVLILGTMIAFWPDALEAKREAVRLAAAKDAAREVVYEA